MSILYLIPIWFFLALLIPTIWSMSKAYKRTWGRRIVICPETNHWANIQLDARPCDPNACLESGSANSVLFTVARTAALQPGMPGSSSASGRSRLISAWCCYYRWCEGGSNAPVRLLLRKLPEGIYNQSSHFRNGERRREVP